MNYVLEKPSTTQSLAQILLMTESSVSRHLQILKRRKVIESKKSEEVCSI